MTEQPQLKAKDYKSDQEVRWCPGCGDYAILSNIQKAVAATGLPREKHLFVSGIGCSSRFPFYMETWGFHTIHGRAPAFATGAKLQNPESCVWVVTGDGDGLSIGGNHLLHLMRRNVDVQLLLFNNEIYGLTKGQYSPTSGVGLVTKSAPMGSIDGPVSPARLALGANASFFARVIDTDHKSSAEIYRRAVEHKGTAVIEILQNCVIFNDGVFDHITDKKTAKEHQLHLAQGEPLRFGAEGDKGIAIVNNQPTVVTLGENGITEADLIVHDEQAGAFYGGLLAGMDSQTFPAPLGVLWAHDRPSYEQQAHSQVEKAKSRPGAGDLHRLLHAADTWVVD